MVVIFYAVLAFVLAQCVFWSIQGTSYAGLAVTVVSVVGASKFSAALASQFQGAAGQGAVNSSVHAARAPARVQLIGVRHLAGQCLVNNAPISNMPTQTVSSACEYLEVWAHKDARGLAYVHAQSRTQASCAMCPLQKSLSSISPTASLSPTNTSTPTHTPDHRYRTRLGTKVLLGAFGGLFGLAFLAMRLSSKIVFSRLIGNPTWDVLYDILVGEAVRMRQQQVPPMWMYYQKPSDSAYPVETEQIESMEGEEPDMDRNLDASAVQREEAGASDDVRTVTVTSEGAVTVEVDNLVLATTPGHSETSLTVEEPAALDSSWQSDDTNSTYTSDDAFDDHDSHESTSGPSGDSDTSNEATHSLVQDSSSSDQVLALVTKFGSLSLSAEGLIARAGPNENETHNAQPSEPAPSSAAAQASTAQPGSIQPSTPAPTSLATVLDPDHVALLDVTASITTSAGFEAVQHPSEPFASTARGFLLRAVEENGDMAGGLESQQVGGETGAQAVASMTERFVGITLECLAHATEANEEMADGLGDEDVAGELHEMAADALAAVAQDGMAAGNNDTLEVLASTTEVAIDVVPATQPVQQSLAAAALPLTPSAAVNTIALSPSARKRKTPGTSRWEERIQKLNDESAHSTKRRKMLPEEVLGSEVESSQPDQVDIPPTQPSASVVLVETAPAPRLERKADGKRKAIEKKASSSKKAKSAEAYREGYRAAMADIRLKEKKEAKGRKSRKREERVEGKRSKKDSKGKGRAVEQEREREEDQEANACLNESENMASSSTSTVLDEVATPTQDLPVDEIPTDNGEPALVEPAVASSPSLDEPLDVTSTAATPAQNEDDTHDQDHPLEPSVDAQPDAAQEQEEQVPQPHDPRPPAKIRKVILRVREPEPETETSGVERSRMNRAIRSHQQPYQVARRKRKEEEETSAGASAGSEDVAGAESAAHEGGPSTSTGPQGAPAATQDPTQWLGDFWVELKEMLATTPSVEDKNNAAGPSTGAGIRDVPKIVETARAEEPSGSETAAQQVTDSGSPPDLPSSTPIPQAIVDDALRDLRSMLDGFKQSLAAAESSSHPDTSTLANSSNETGSSEPSRLFSVTANSSVDTQEPDLPDYEDAIGAGSSEVDVQVKQEEEEYVFPPWDGGVASGSQLSEDTEQVDMSTEEEAQAPVAEAPLEMDAAWTSRAKRQREDDRDDDDFLPLKRMKALAVTSSEDN